VEQQLAKCEDRVVTDTGKINTVLICIKFSEAAEVPGTTLLLK